MRHLLGSLALELAAGLGLLVWTACGAPPEPGAGPSTMTPAEPAPSARHTSPTGLVLRLERHSVQDRQGFGTEAFSLLLPQGWKFQGQLEWEIQTGGIPRPVLQFAGSSPDGSAAVTMLPDQVFAYADDPMLQASLAAQGSQVLPALSLRDYCQSEAQPHTWARTERVGR